MACEAKNRAANTKQFGDMLCRRIGKQRYELWFAHKTKFLWSDDKLVIGVANHFYQDWLQKTFAEDIAVVVRELHGWVTAVDFIIDAELFQSARREQQQQQGRVAGSAMTSLAPGSPSEDHGPQEHKAADLPTCAVRPGATGQGRSRRRDRRWRRLTEFVVGPCNRLAHAAGLNLIEQPGHGPTPLVLHGPTGTGKTHLLEGIYAGLRQSRPDWHVCFATAEEFTNRFVQSMRLGKLSEFRKHFRDCDVLLVDDINFLAGKRATEEEFLHTLTALLAEERQVVLSCDCHPRLSDEFLPELADRLMGGAVWGLIYPDRDTRLNLLRSLAAKKTLSISEEVLGFIAEHVRGNARELSGALHSIGHLAHVSDRPVDLTLAREAIGDLLRHSVRVLQMSDVERAVCTVLHLDSAALQSRKRGWMYSQPRMLAMYLARKHTGATYQEIGQYFGGRNHSTTVAAEKKVRSWLEDDTSLKMGERQVRVRDMFDRISRELAK